GYFIYQSTIRVPLIVRAPGGAPGTRVAEPVSIVDVVPTIQALRGVTVPRDLDGRDLSPLVLGRRPRTEPQEAYFESVTPAVFGCSVLHGVRSGTWKYTRAATAELYDLAQDPAEVHNLAEQKPDTARLLRDRL